MRALAAAFVAVALLAAPGRAGAAVTLTTELGAPKAEVGENVQLVLTAMSDAGEDVRSPRLEGARGLVVRGPSVSSQQQISIVNGRITRSVGLTSTWTITAAKPGSLTLGPASVVVDGKVKKDRPVTIEIVPVGSLPQQRRSPLGLGGRQRTRDPFDFDPFDFFTQRQRSSRDPLGFDPDTAFPEEYRVVHAPDATAFLIASVTPKRAVVGQQVTLTVRAYGALGPFKEVDSSEPSRADFFSHSLIDNSYGQRLFRVPVEGATFYATTIRQVALFPLRAGDLEIGAMTFGFSGQRYGVTPGRQGLIRKSAPITVTAEEPPLAGRPPGYQLGDVGAFTLTAEVSPREIEAGGSVSVVVQLTGTGQLPRRLRTPEQSGAAWLEPNVTESLAVSGGSLGGRRSFTFLVELSKPGAVDLGAITLPFYDPNAGAFRVARASLGSVTVHPSPADRPESPPTADVPSAPDPLEALITVRGELGPSPERARHSTDTPVFWAALLGAPFGIIATSVGLRLARAVMGRARRRRSAHSTRARDALAEARTLQGNGDTAGAASAVERSLYFAIEHATGLKGRAVLRAELETLLTEHDVPVAIASELHALLEACDGLRFAHNEVDASELVGRASATVAALLELSA